MIAELVRLEESNMGTVGVLLLAGSAFCVTLEPPDRDNRVDLSCIPEGNYTCRRHHSPHFGETFRVDEVPGRSEILIHPGNTVDDTAGCILVAEKFGKLCGERAVLNSGRTFGKLMIALEGIDEFSLHVHDVTGGPA